MYVKQLSLSNFKTIKEFEATFDGNIYIVTGENDIGKSTFLKAITILLTGERDEVLSTGEEKGYAKAVVGDDKVNYDVELRFTKANPKGTLSIKQQGTTMSSDRISALQAIFGYQEFDAEEFIRWSETAEGRRKQVEIVRSLMPNSAQERLDTIDKEILSLEEKRLQDGRELKIYDGTVKGLEKEVTSEDVVKYAQPVVLQELIDKKTNLAADKLKYDGVKERKEAREKELAQMPIDLATEEESVATNVSEIDADIARLKQKKEDYLQSLEEFKSAQTAQRTLLEAQIAKAKQYLEVVIVPNVDEVQAEIDNAQTHNDKNKKVVDYLAQKAKYTEVATRIETHNSDIAKLKAEKEEIIKTAKLPIEGLSFSSEGLTLNGIPFVHDKVSTSEEMEVAAKLIIAKNPTTKVFRIARGESLGKAKFDALVSFAKKEGFQGFIEEVKRGQPELIVNEYSEKL